MGIEKSCHKELPICHDKHVQDPEEGTLVHSESDQASGGAVKNIFEAKKFQIQDIAAGCNPRWRRRSRNRTRILPRKET
jgi:hypothetical protein